MQVLWENTDITEYVSIAGCIHREVSHGGSDLLDLRMRNSATWYQWDPRTDDRIRIIHKGYDTGTMYLHSLRPDGDGFRVLASSTKSAAEHRAWKSYRNMTLSQLVTNMAVECGMQGVIYGGNGGYIYPYLERQNEGCLAFLDRIARRESMALKAVGGALRAIYIPWAQQRDALAKLTVTAGQEGAVWTRMERNRWGKVTVITPQAESWAVDVADPGRPERIFTGLSVSDSTTAGRWARGILLDHNRECETLEIETGLSTRFTAMERVDVDGNTAASGNWIVDRAEHDIKNERSSVTLVRCIYSIR